MRKIAETIAKKILAQCEIEGTDKNNLDYKLFWENDLAKLLHENYKVFIFYYEPDHVKMNELYSAVLISLNISYSPEQIVIYQGDYFCALPK